MSKALETGKSILPGLLAKLPESLRATVEAAFSAPEATDAVTELGARALAQADYSRLADEIRDKEAKLTEDYNNLNAWYTEKQGFLSEYDRIKPEYDQLKTGVKPVVTDPNATKVTTTGLSQAEIEKILTDREAARDEGYAGVLAVTTTLTAKHLKDFNEVPDIEGCIAQARKQHISLVDAYNQKYAEQIKARADAAETARIEKLVTERLTAERSKLTDPNHFPLRNQSPSVLDILETKGDASKHTVDSAVALYDQLSNARST